ncbi:MAG: NAD-dependent epimerase/dehydratase family protein [Candidatus Omnitrophica bacterium]|nr:NAD-dependent epimerase/dehydratase family protein [Candidatus Omnitrophota bacterium]
MQNKKVLVTGAGGFIGSHLAKRLYEEGVFVRVVDIKWDDYMPDRYYSEKLTLDLRDLDSCLKATKDIEYVFNFAADMGGIGYIGTVGADIMHNSGLININMLQASVENKIERFMFSSSACIYPEYKQLDSKVTALKEEDAYPAQPDQFYGWEKLFSEILCEAYRKDYKLDTRVVRFHNIFGPYGTWDGGREKAPAALCRKIIMAENLGTIDIWGDGKQTRSFCYIDDCLEGVCRLMESDYIHPLNVGSDELVTIDELTDMVIRISGKKIMKEYDISKPQGVRGRNSDNTLIKKILGWAPSTRLEEGLKKTYPWIEQQILKKKQNKEMIR